MSDPMSEFDAQLREVLLEAGWAPPAEVARLRAEVASGNIIERRLSEANQALEAERDAALRERDEARDRARKERAVATEAAAVLEMTVSAMRGEPADDFAESFVPIQIAQDLWRANAANLAESAALRARLEEARGLVEEFLRDVNRYPADDLAGLQGRCAAWLAAGTKAGPAEVTKP